MTKNPAVAAYLAEARRRGMAARQRANAPKPKFDEASFFQSATGPAAPPPSSRKPTDAEDAEIAKWLEQHQPTRCPPAFIEQTSAAKDAPIIKRRRRRRKVSDAAAE